MFLDFHLTSPEQVTAIYYDINLCDFPPVFKHRLM